jgi:hypothetical protein
MIMCDAPAYAIFSNGPEFDAYAATLKGKIARRAEDPDFLVDLMFFANKEREQIQRHATDRYAKTDDEWISWRESPEVNRQLRALLKRSQQLCNPEGGALSDDEVTRRLQDLTVDDFVRGFDAVDDALTERHFYGANRYILMLRDGNGAPQALANGPSIYFWMRDNVEAIFAVVAMGEEIGEARDVGFQTRDPSMINALRGIFSRYKRAAISLQVRDLDTEVAV